MNLRQFEGYKRVEQFKYLGGVVTENNKPPTEIKTRLASGNVL